MYRSLSSRAPPPHAEEIAPAQLVPRPIPPGPESHNEFISVNEDNVVQVVSDHPLRASQSMRRPGQTGSAQGKVSAKQRSLDMMRPEPSGRTSTGRSSLDNVRRSLDMILRPLKAVEKEPSEDDEEHAVAGTATLAEHLLIRALEKDFAKLLVLQVDREGHSLIREDMNRFDLLSACRKADPQNGRNLSLVGAPVQLRDIRCLQGVSEPALLVRRGAILLSIDPVNTVITDSVAYLVLPDGADEMLAPMLARLREPPDPTLQKPVAFEFIVFESLLVSLHNELRTDTRSCRKETRELMDLFHLGVSERLLRKIAKLKRRINQVLEAVGGAQETLEEVQADDQLMALMFLSKMRDDPAGYNRQLHDHTCDVMTAEVILDTYALHFQRLSRKLQDALREIDDNADTLKFKLSHARNELIRLDVVFGVVSMFLGMLTVMGGYFGMNLPFGGYTDGSEPPGGNFTPPTAGGIYDPAWVGGPQKAFLAVTLGSSLAGIALFLATMLAMWRCHVLRI